MNKFPKKAGFCALINKCTYGSLTSYIFGVIRFRWRDQFILQLFIQSHRSMTQAGQLDIWLFIKMYCTQQCQPWSLSDFSLIDIRDLTMLRQFFNHQQMPSVFVTFAAWVGSALIADVSCNMMLVHSSLMSLSHFKLGMELFWTSTHQW